MFRAVLFDFGGVILSSPFEAFNDYEREHGLPIDFIRTVNSRDPHANAWARLERAEIDADGFDAAFATESEAIGHRLAGADVLALLSGAVRSEVVDAVRGVNRRGLRTACLTNNVAGVAPPAEIVEILALFDDIVESSVIGVRKPERRFYEIACERLGVTPVECVFLDDLGINLKPARDMGMTTIKVMSGPQAVADLEAVLGG